MTTCPDSPDPDALFRAAAVEDGVEVGGDPLWSGGHPITASKPGGPRDGVFARWAWDGREFVAVNDRYGFYPLFYWAEPGSIVISPSIVRLLNEGAPRDLDDAAIAAFLRFGSYVGEDTPFKSIRAVPPGATLTWSADRLDLTGGNYVFPSLEKMSRDQALNEYADRFREAVRRRLCPGEAIVLPLSGGRDSRHILFELCELGAKPTLAVTAQVYPPAWRQDVEIAALVAQRLGVPHSVLEQEPRAQAEWGKNLETGFCTEKYSWTMAVKRVLGDRRVRLFDGIAGDILSPERTTAFGSDGGLFLDRRGLELFEEGRFAPLSQHVCRRGGGDPERGLQLILSPTAYRRFAPEAGYERIEQELRRHTDAPNPVSSFFFWNRTRRDIALMPFRVYRHHTVLAPFLDHDVFDLLAALPASLFLDGEFHTDAINRAHPRHTELPFATQRHNLRRDRSHFRHFAQDLVERAVKRRSLSPLRVPLVGPRLVATALSGMRNSALPRALYLFQLDQIAVSSPMRPTTGSRH